MTWSRNRWLQSRRQNRQKMPHRLVQMKQPAENCLDLFDTRDRTVAGTVAKKNGFRFADGQTRQALADAVGTCWIEPKQVLSATAFQTSLLTCKGGSVVSKHPVLVLGREREHEPAQQQQFEISSLESVINQHAKNFLLPADTVVGRHTPQPSRSSDR